MAAITVGVGLGGSLACGQNPQLPVPAPNDGSADAVQSPDVAQLGHDTGGLADVVVDKHDVFEPPCGVK